MRQFSVARCCAIIVVFATLFPARAADSFDDLLKRLPGTSNMLVAVNIEKIHQSAIGKKEGSREKHQADYVGGQTRIPPTGRKLLFGSHLNPATLQTTSEVGVFEDSEDISMVRVAKDLGGSLDSIADHRIVAGPRNTYYVALGGKTLGLIRPANRQEVARWLRSSQGQAEAKLSEYLQSAAQQLDRGIEVLVAVDLQDVLDVKGVKERLAKCAALAGKESELDAIARAVCSLKGVQLRLDFQNAIEGNLRLDFSQDPSAIYPYAKQLVLEAMEKMGAKVDDIEGWEVRTEGAAIMLHGQLSTAGLRLVLSPFISSAASAGVHHQGEPGVDPMVSASLKYYKSLTTLLGDLRKQKAPLKKYGYWYEKYCNNVDELPSLNVDPELLQVGNFISSILRQLSVASRATSGTVTVLEGSKGNYMLNYGDPGIQNVGGYWGGGGYGGGGYGGWGYSTYDPGQVMVDTHATMALQQNKLTMQLDAFKLQAWTQMDTVMSAIRKKLTQKYQIEF